MTKIISYSKRVNGRTINELINAFEGIICVGIEMKTDGFASYLSFAEHLASRQRIINLGGGFLADNGPHTNNVEAFWSQLEQKMRSQHGTRKENVDEMLV